VVEEGGVVEEREEADDENGDTTFSVRSGRLQGVSTNGADSFDMILEEPFNNNISINKKKQ
jgi:hypothetical protein